VSGLPGNPPPVLVKALDQHPIEVQRLFIAHLQGGTSCDWLADRLAVAGTPVGATTLKRYRRSLVERSSA
jgi:hypothetical protein